MKQKSQILIKYVVIPFLFTAILIMMDFFSNSIQQQEKVIRSNSIFHLANNSCIFTYTESHSFGYISDNKNLSNNQNVVLFITPIFGKVKAYSPTVSAQKKYISLSGLICQVFLPIIIIITGLFGIRSSNMFCLFLIIAETILLTAHLVIM